MNSEQALQILTNLSTLALKGGLFESLGDTVTVHSALNVLGTTIEDYNKLVTEVNTPDVPKVKASIAD